MSPLPAGFGNPGAPTIPWEALVPESPGRGQDWSQFKLAYGPELATATAWMLARDEVVSEGTHPDFAAKAIAT
ncbi:hypothetical protein [Micromonospora sp. CB01531]|uniref:hypothetical protein n=1 Tax=Micromonospora sp. CB01531 TaxID=1718947 RepID=UPI0011614D12|nr:hypothetical protein [Micromonospora sp. CB01531]